MLILTIRTDKPEAELGLYEGKNKLKSLVWVAHRKLAEQLLGKIEDLLADQQKTFPDIKAIAVYEGPGSFTGLRIGVSTANALAYGLNIPVIAKGGNDWEESAIDELLQGNAHPTAIPNYGQTAHITQPKR